MAGTGFLLGDAGASTVGPRMSLLYAFPPGTATVGGRRHPNMRVSVRELATSLVEPVPAAQTEPACPTCPPPGRGASLHEVPRQQDSPPFPDKLTLGATRFLDQ